MDASKIGTTLITHHFATKCNLLTKDSQNILDVFGTFRGAHFKDRIRLLEVCGLYRQTWQGTFNLWLATIFNKI